MSINPYNIKMFLSILMTAFVIKAVDDYLDSDMEEDMIFIKGQGVLVYTLILFAFACTLSSKTSVTLFASAYIVGMFSDYKRVLISGLKGYQEGIIIFIIMIIFYRYSDVVSSFFIIFLTQLIDDILDIEKDKKYNCHNYAIKYGMVETILLSLILLILSFYIDSIKLIFSLAAFTVIEVSECLLKRRENCADNN